MIDDNVYQEEEEENNYFMANICMRLYKLSKDICYGYIQNRDSN